MNRYYIVEYFAELENAEKDGAGLVVDKCINNFDECKKFSSFTSYNVALGELHILQCEIFPLKGQFYTVGAKVYTLEHNNKIMHIAEIVDARLTN